MGFKNMSAKEKVAFVEENAMGILVFVAMVILFINVILRKFTTDSVIWAEEFIRYAMIWITFVGAAVAFRKESHFGVDLILRIPNKYFVKAIRCFIDMASIAFNCFVFYYGYKLVAFSMAKNQITVALGWPIWVIYIIIPISAAMSIIYLCFNLYKKMKTPAEHLMLRQQQS